MNAKVDAEPFLARSIDFGRFRLDEANASLSADGRPIDLPPKAFAVLCRLAASPGELVTKETLLDAVWGHRFVSESVLKTAVNTIRTQLEDDPAAPGVLETVRGRGYRFVAAITGAAPTPAPRSADAARPARPAAAPIGRADAAADVAVFLDLAMPAGPRLLLVVGEAGVGKSTLVDHAVALAEAEGYQVARGQCGEQSGGGEPYLPLLDALDALCAGLDGVAWTEALRRTAPGWLAQLPWHVPEADVSGLRQALAGSAQERMLREFAMLLDRVEAGRPLLLVLEDLHWSDQASIELLGYLARRRTGAGGGAWRVIASFRPADLAADDHPLRALRQELGLHRQCREVALGNFTVEDVHTLVAERLPGLHESAREPLARALHAHCDGLPLFLDQLIAELRAGDASAGDAGSGWTLPPDALAALAVPRTVAGIIERRIARLPPGLPGLLESASVLGAGFLHPLLADVLEAPEATIRQQCDGLVRRGEWLRAAGMSVLPDQRLAQRYEFRHALLQRVLLGRVAPGERLRLHLRAARGLQAACGRAGEHHAEVAQHWERARDIAAAEGARLDEAAREAVAARLRAAAAACSVHAPADALAHYAQALAGGPAPAERIAILAAQSRLLVQLGRGAAALDASAAALADAGRLGEPAPLAIATLCRAQVCVRAERLAEALSLTRSLLEQGARVTAAQRLEALAIRAEGLQGGGRLREADEVLQQASAAVPPGAPAQLARIVANRVMLHFQRGSLEEALPLAEQALALYEEAGDARGAIYMQTRIGALACMTGRLEESERVLHAALERAAAVGDVDGQRSALLNLVKLLTDRGDADAALPLLDRGWALAPDFESPVAECAFLHGYFYCNYLRGRLGAALDDARRVMALADELCAVYWQVGSAVLVLDLYLHLGEFAHANALVEAALARAHIAEVHQQWVKIAIRRTGLLLARGELDAARAQIAEIAARGELGPDEDRARLDLVRSQAALLAGDPAGALAIVSAYEDAPTLECWATMLALRLQARAAGTDADFDADVARARAQLEDCRLPALESLVLRRALADALAARGLPCQQERAAARALRDRLAESLAVDPGRRSAFVTRFD